MKYVLNSEEFVTSVVFGAIEQQLIPATVGDLDVAQVQLELAGNGGVLITVNDEAKPKKVRASRAVPAPDAAEATAPTGRRRRRNTETAPAATNGATEEEENFDGVPVADA